MHEYWTDVDLLSLPDVRNLGSVFEQDSSGNKIGARVKRGGIAQRLTGTVSAKVIKPDGTTITVSGSKSGDTAWVILPESAYAIPGRIRITLKLTNSTDIMTLCSVEGIVYQTITSEVIS